MRSRARVPCGRPGRGWDADARTGRPSLDAHAVEHEDDPRQWVEDRNGRHQADGGVRGPGADAGRAARRRTGHVGTHPGHPQRPDTRARRRAARRAAHDVDGAVGHQNHAVPDPVDEDDRVRQTDAASETKTDTEGDGEGTKTHRRAAPAAAKAHGPAPQPASVLRDAVRLGLPVAVLRARPSDAELNGELLVAAALLLAAAAGGSLLLGITARSATRHA